MPQVILLDLELPESTGPKFSSGRADWTKLLPVVILISSKEEQDLIDGYTLGRQQLYP